MILPLAKILLRHIGTLPAGDDPKAALCPGLEGKASGWLSNQFYNLMASAGLVPARTHKRQISVTLRDGKTHLGQIQCESKAALRLSIADGKTVDIRKVDIVSRTDGKARTSRRALNEISFHALRHTATSLLKNAGVSDVIARDIIGHESEEISRKYTHIESETKRRAIDSMPDVMRPLEQLKLGLQ